MHATILHHHKSGAWLFLRLLVFGMLCVAAIAVIKHLTG
jgi:hypothetical protein